MHWTTLADTEIFAMGAITTGSTESTHSEEIVMGDARLIVTRYADGHAVIERIISPVPSDYLNPAWQPGMHYGG